MAFPIPVIMETEQGNIQCETTIPMTLPAMTYAVIGSGEYSWVSTLRRAALNPANPSFNSITGPFRIESFTELWTANTATAALTQLQGTKKPDVILYFAFGAAPSVALSTALADYINQGGCVMYGSADNTENSVNDMLEGVFGSRFAAGQVSGSGSGDGWSNADSYLIKDSPDNPIINGPFGNAAGKRWCEDSSSTGSVIMTSLPNGSIQICSASNDKSKVAVPVEHSIVWMNDKYNFVYFGDCVATSSSTSGNWWPARYRSNGVPFDIEQSYGGGRATMANSTLELNAVAWLINKAALNGINEY